MNQTNETSLWELPTTRSTSRRARRQMGPRAGSIKGRILRAVADAGAQGLTDDEGELLLKIRCSSYTPRRGELVTSGWITDSGIRRDTEAGHPAIVWTITQSGMRVLKEER